MILNKLPFVHNLVARLKKRRERKVLLQTYNHMMGCLRKTSISSISFQANACIYSLADGRNFLFDPERSAGWLYSVPYSGVFEEKETEFVRRTIQPGWVCFDVGACFGWYSVLFSNGIGDMGGVHAFEPVTSNRECLMANLGLNAASGNVKVNPYALGQEQGATKIYIPTKGVSGSLKAHENIRNCQIVDIEITTLDSYVAENDLQRLDFIKADIEGAEFLMLQGAESTLRKYHPILMLEIQRHSTQLFGYEPEKIFTWLKDLGYKPYYVSADYELIACDNQLNGSDLPDYNFIFKYEAQA